MSTDTQASTWTAKQALFMALISLCLGGAFGYFAHGPSKGAAAASLNAAAPASEQSAGEQPNPAAPSVDASSVSPEMMKQASAKATIPILEQLKKDPKNFKLLVQVGDMYYHHQAFADATQFYQRALEVEDNEGVRAQLAGALFYSGDSDSALAQYAKVLQKNPKSDIALFNTGMILLKAKNDKKGAVESWQKLLKAFPNHPHRDQVQHMIEQVEKS